MASLTSIHCMVALNASRNSQRIYSFGKKPDYSGFDWLNWPHRDLKAQKDKGKEFKNALI